MNNIEALKQIKFEEQLITPSKIVCVGRNYGAHVRELNNEMPSAPVIFVKPNSAISYELRSGTVDEIHYEAELVFLIENGRFRAVGVGLDLTKRQVQSELKNKGLPWERAKAFDASAVFSDFVSLPDSIDELSLALYIDGELAQKGDVSQMIFSPADLLEDITGFMSLLNGDLVMTGTPDGVGRVKTGQLFEAKVYQESELLVSASWLAN